MEISCRRLRKKMSSTSRQSMKLSKKSSFVAATPSPMKDSKSENVKNLKSSNQEVRSDKPTSLVHNLCDVALETNDVPKNKKLASKATKKSKVQKQPGAVGTKVVLDLKAALASLNITPGSYKEHTVLPHTIPYAIKPVEVVLKNPDDGKLQVFSVKMNVATALLHSSPQQDKAHGMDLTTNEQNLIKNLNKNPPLKPTDRVIQINSVSTPMPSQSTVQSKTNIVPVSNTAVYKTFSNKKSVIHKNRTKNIQIELPVHETNLTMISKESHAIPNNNQTNSVKHICTNEGNSMCSTSNTQDINASPTKFDADKIASQYTNIRPLKLVTKLTDVTISAAVDQQETDAIKKKKIITIMGPSTSNCGPVHKQRTLMEDSESIIKPVINYDDTKNKNNSQLSDISNAPTLVYQMQKTSNEEKSKKIINTTSIGVQTNTRSIAISYNQSLISLPTPTSTMVSKIKKLFANSSVPLTKETLQPLTIIQTSAQGSTTETNLESISTLIGPSTNTNIPKIDISKLPVKVSNITPHTIIKGVSISTETFNSNVGEKIVEEIQKLQEKPDRIEAPIDEIQNRQEKPDRIVTPVTAVKEVTLPADVDFLLSYRWPDQPVNEVPSTKSTCSISPKSSTADSTSRQATIRNVNKNPLISAGILHTLLKNPQNVANCGNSVQDIQTTISSSNKQESQSNPKEVKEKSVEVNNKDVTNKPDLSLEDLAQDTDSNLNLSEITSKSSTTFSENEFQSFIQENEQSRILSSILETTGEDLIKISKSHDLNRKESPSQEFNCNEIKKENENLKQSDEIKRIARQIRINIKDSQEIADVVISLNNEENLIIQKKLQAIVTPPPTFVITPNGNTFEILPCDPLKRIERTESSIDKSQPSNVMTTRQSTLINQATSSIDTTLNVTSLKNAVKKLEKVARSTRQRTASENSQKSNDSNSSLRVEILKNAPIEHDSPEPAPLEHGPPLPECSSKNPVINTLQSTSFESDKLQTTSKASIVTCDTELVKPELSQTKHKKLVTFGETIKYQFVPLTENNIKKITKTTKDLVSILKVKSSDILNTNQSNDNSQITEIRRREHHKKVKKQKLNKNVLVLNSESLKDYVNIFKNNTKISFRNTVKLVQLNPTKVTQETEEENGDKICAILDVRSLSTGENLDLSNPKSSNNYVENLVSNDSISLLNKTKNQCTLNNSVSSFNSTESLEPQMESLHGGISCFDSSTQQQNSEFLNNNIKLKSVTVQVNLNENTPEKSSQQFSESGFDVIELNIPSMEHESIDKLSANSTQNSTVKNLNSSQTAVNKETISSSLDGALTKGSKKGKEKSPKSQVASSSSILKPLYARQRLEQSPPKPSTSLTCSSDAGSSKCDKRPWDSLELATDDSPNKRICVSPQSSTCSDSSNDSEMIGKFKLKRTTSESNMDTSLLEQVEMLLILNARKLGHQFMLRRKNKEMHHFNQKRGDKSELNIYLILAEHCKQNEANQLKLSDNLFKALAVHKNISRLPSSDINVENIYLVYSNMGILLDDKVKNVEIVNCGFVKAKNSNIPLKQIYNIKPGTAIEKVLQETIQLTLESIELFMKQFVFSLNQPSLIPLKEKIILKIKQIFNCELLQCKKIYEKLEQFTKFSALNSQTFKEMFENNISNTDTIPFNIACTNFNTRQLDAQCDSRITIDPVLSTRNKNAELDYLNELLETVSKILHESKFKTTKIGKDDIQIWNNACKYEELCSKWAEILLLPIVNMDISEKIIENFIEQHVFNIENIANIDIYIKIHCKYLEILYKYCNFEKIIEMVDCICLKLPTNYFSKDIIQIMMYKAQSLYVLDNSADAWNILESIFLENEKSGDYRTINDWSILISMVKIASELGNEELLLMCYLVISHRVVDRKMDPNRIHYYLRQLGYILITDGKPKEAIKLYDQIILQYSNNSEYQGIWSYSLFMKANVLYIANQYTCCWKILRQLVDIADNNLLENILELLFDVSYKTNNMDYIQILENILKERAIKTNGTMENILLNLLRECNDRNLELDIFYSQTVSKISSQFKPYHNITLYTLICQARFLYRNNKLEKTWILLYNLFKNQSYNEFHFDIFKKVLTLFTEVSCELYTVEKPQYLYILFDIYYDIIKHPLKNEFNSVITIIMGKITYHMKFENKIGETLKFISNIINIASTENKMILIDVLCLKSQFLLDVNKLDTAWDIYEEICKLCNIKSVNRIENYNSLQQLLDVIAKR